MTPFIAFSVCERCLRCKRLLLLQECFVVFVPLDPLYHTRDPQTLKSEKATWKVEMSQSTSWQVSSGRSRSSAHAGSRSARSSNCSRSCASFAGVDGMKRSPEPKLDVERGIAW